MIKNWSKFNENFDDEEDDIKQPIGINDLECAATNGLVCIFSELEDDMIDDWNSDEIIKKFIEEKRLFLTEIKYDQWAIYAIEGDKEVKRYIKKNYSW